MLIITPIAAMVSRMRVFNLLLFGVSHAHACTQGYLARMKAFAPILAASVKGKSTVCFSHAASSAIVASLTNQDLEEVKYNLSDLTL